MQSGVLDHFALHVMLTGHHIFHSLHCSYAFPFKFPCYLRQNPKLLCHKYYVIEIKSAFVGTTFSPLQTRKGLVIKSVTKMGITRQKENLQNLYLVLFLVLFF